MKELLNNYDFLLDVVILLVLELVYFKLADRYNIIDKPNERSSHTIPTIRGGGIIFVFSLLLLSIGNYFAYPYLVAAVLLSGAVSFIDDIRGLPSIVRFSAHFISALLLLLQSDFITLPIAMLAAIIVLIIAIINAYNFMDGINGITGFYSLAVIVPLLLTEPSEELRELQVYITVGLLIFLLFNARIKARCFAGDVGSVSMAILVVFLLMQRIYATGNANYICFLLLYGVDTGMTIAQRLLQKENIFQAHRKHLFQLLSNEYKLPHLVVALLYALLQFFINYYIAHTTDSIWITVVFSLITAAIYILLKKVLLQRVKTATVAS